MAVHGGASVEGVQYALQSVSEQTQIPDEFVVVEDGVLTEEQKSVVRHYGERLPIRSIKLAENQGLGAALSAGVEACANELVARMDADDICSVERIERQVEFLERNPDISVVGSWIKEISTDRAQESRERCLPCDPGALRKSAKRRCPINHMTAMFRRSHVLEAGNYKDLRIAQDYHLWGRMLAQGYKLANVPEYLVNAMAGEEMIARRGGWNRLSMDIYVQRELVRYGLLSSFDLVINIPARVAVRLMPAGIRGIVYRMGWRRAEV